MEILISLLMGTRLLTLFGGWVGHDAATVSFVQPKIIVVGEEVRLSCGLKDAFPEELKKLAASATPVVLYLFVEFREDAKRLPVRKMTVESRLQYDFIEKRYTVTMSAGADTLRSGSLDTAIGYACRFGGIPVAKKTDISRDAAYMVAAYAVLGKTKIEALYNKEVDLMYYWDFKRPSFKTEKIDGKEFLRP